RDGMRPIVRSQLAEDVLSMNLHGMLGQKEPISDVAIPISFLDVGEYVKLPSGELFIAEMLGEPGRDLGQDTLLSGMDLTDRLEHLVGRHALQQIRAGSGFEGALNLDIPREHG